jgi:hypothetical protein
MANRSIGWWSPVGCDWPYPDYLYIKIRKRKFENAPFSSADETYGDVTNRERAFWTPQHFQDETYGDVKTSGYNLPCLIARGRNVQGCLILVPISRQAYFYFGIRLKLRFNKIATCVSVKLLDESLPALHPWPSALFVCLGAFNRL